jgi:uncharacterized protein (DUF4415 family)
LAGRITCVLIAKQPFQWRSLKERVCAACVQGAARDSVDRLTDKTIDYSDIPALDESFLSKAVQMPWPPAKRQLTIRLDEDVLTWLRSLGKGYQTRINRILRMAMESRRPAPRRGTGRGRRSSASATPKAKKLQAG